MLSIVSHNFQTPSLAENTYRVVQLAIFASGTGSNARKIMAYFEDSSEVRVALVVSNRRDAPVLQAAAEKGIPTLVTGRDTFYENNGLLGAMDQYAIDLIILAGFLWLIPEYLVRAFNRRIINIHPALLPRFGGKGMYGHFVHEAVLAAGESESGITIHLIDGEYDKGTTLFQAKCPVVAGDTPETLAAKVQQLEHQYFPPIIHQYIRESLPSLLSKNQAS